jgi:putative ABC transport system permease protein
MRVLNWFAQDLRYGLRGLRKDVGFATLAVLALALGIGASTVIFSVIDNVLLEPFPYRAPERLTKFYVHDPAHPDHIGRVEFSMPEFTAFKEQNHVFEDIIATTGLDVLYTDKEGTKEFRGLETTANTFDFFGIKPLLGRAMVLDDGRADAPPVAVMSYRAWQREFSGDPNIVGKLLTLNGTQTAVIGIMPPRFEYSDGDFWMPLKFDRADVDPQHRIYTISRLKPGVTLQAMSSDLEVIAKRLAKDYPKDYPANFTITTATLADRVVGKYRGMLYTLLGAVTMLLLIACSNVANLLLARATAREREIAIRASMGASRARLVSQLMVESFVLAGLGCAAGWLFAYGGIKGVTAAVPPYLLPSEAVITLNVRVLLFALGITCLTTILCGLAPAFHSVRGELHQHLKTSGAGASAGSGQSRSRSFLAVAQVAMTIVLMVGAGLMMRSLLALYHLDLGFTPDHILSARTPLPQGRYDSAEKKQVFFSQVLQRISALPGVVAATENTTIPPFGGIGTEVTVPGKVHAEKWRSIFQLCSEGYFKTVGIRLLRGRLLSEADVASARQVVVINETLGKRFFGGEDPIGKSIKFNTFDAAPESPKDAYFEIVGVVADLKNRGIQGTDPEAFLPYTITGTFSRGILVRTRVEPMSLLESVRREIWAVDPGVALVMPGTVESFIDQWSYSQPRFELILFGLFASIGLVLAAIGVFSVLAYSVSLQTHEIGIRMALGAQQSAVLRMVIKKGLGLVAIGIAVGELASLGLTRFVRSELWYVSPHDPATFIAVLAVLITVGLAACIVPAHRATQVDPLVALRHE